MAQVTYFDMLEPKGRCKHSWLPDGIMRDVVIQGPTCNAK